MNKNKISKTKTHAPLFCLAAILGGFFIWPNFARAAASDIVFTEIMYNPAGSDSDREWVEIYNTGAEPVTIIGSTGSGSWRFNDGDSSGPNHTLKLIQGSLTLPPGGIAILVASSTTFLADYSGFSGTIIDTAMDLKNTNGTLKLSADKGVSFFSETTYQSTCAANATVCPSLEKINPTGGNDASNWRASTADGGTPGIVSTTDQSPPDNTATSTPPTTSTIPAMSGQTSSPAPADAKKVKISEILPNPDKEQKEFVELVNNNYSSITLEGWKLADGKKVVALPTITLVANEHRAFFGDDTKIVLNNDGDIISLYDKDGELADKLSYGATVKGQALAYNQAQDKFLWSAKPTPNAANEIAKFNEPPVAKITLSKNPVAPNEEVIISAAESSDPDDDTLAFLWSIGKNWQAAGMNFVYSFKNLGDHLISLKASDGQRESAATTTIKVLPANEVVSLRSQKAGAKVSAPLSGKSVGALASTTPTLENQIFINEIFPNPAGRDEDEWVELFNPNSAPAPLAGWSLDDNEGGSKPYKFTSQIIAAESYLVIKKKESRLLLNNNNETVRLFNPLQQLIEQVAYKDAPENQSYSRDEDDEWFWTEKITPGKTNADNQTINTSNQAVPQSFNYPLPTLTPVWSTGQALPSPGKEEGMPIDIDLANIRELSLGSQVKVQGTVAVEPGVLAKTYFYITGSPGIQVYFSQRDWPRLALGDVVGVIGELTETSGETRLKIADKADIVPLYKSKPPQAEEIATGDIGDNTEGWLVKIAAELVKKQGNNWFVDDGSGEIKITFQNGAKIKKPEAKAGDWIEVTGLVSQTKSGYRLLPRYQDDVKLLDVAKLGEIQGRVLGAATSTAASTDNIQRFRIPANDKPRKILTYLLITSSALIILLAGLLIKLRIETKKRLSDIQKRSDRAL